MSNVIPPMLSDSPPPLDIHVDDDDNGYEDFRVATDLGFELSDSSVGRDSPDVWNTPSTNSELSEERQAKVVLDAVVKTNVSNDYFDNPPDLNGSFNSASAQESISCEKEVFVSDGEFVSNNSINRVNQAETLNHNKDADFEDDTDPPDVAEELDRIPFSPVFSSCDVEFEVRTSPEGADAESAGEEFDFKKVTAGCDLLPVDKSVVFCQSGNPVSDVLAEVKDNESDIDDFADFSSHQFPHESALPKSEPISNIGVSENIENSSLPPPADVIDDDFDDFEFAAPATKSSNIEEEDVGSRLAAIFDSPPEDIAPSENSQLTGCLNACLDDSSSVWGHLKDLEASHALSLQWTTSTASKKLLSSLSVDSRNILIGPRWNSSMPRFAANLGCTPLEPMKALPDEVPPAPVRVISRVPAPVSEDVVPAAQFDWNSSGLTNPLDCMEKEETSVSRESPKLMLKDDTSKSPLEASSDLWEHPPLTTTDILLPSPVGPVLTPIDAFVPASLLQTSDVITEQSYARQEEWLRSDSPVLDIETSRKEMMTISSQLESSIGETSESAEVVAEKDKSRTMSAEAYRVVETLPDLSFLSARKLMYAANANITRFQMPARP